MFLAIFAHPASWPRSKGVTPTQYRVVYRIFDPRTDSYISSYSSPLYNHLGLTPNQIHIRAYRLALTDPILDKYDHTKTVIFCPHSLMSGIIDKAVCGKPMTPNNFTNLFVQKLLPLIDSKSHAPTWTERDPHLNDVLGPLLRFDYPGAVTPSYTQIRAPLTVINTIHKFAHKALKTYEEVHEFNKRQAPLF